MAVFHVKKTSLGEDQTSLVFKGKIVEGPISKGLVMRFIMELADRLKSKS